MRTIVVDNASPDDSAALVREEHPSCELIELEDNLGFSCAVNAGVARGSADIVVVLNPDVELNTEALGRITKWIGGSGDPRIGAVGVRQEDPDGFLQLSIGPRPSLVGELGRKLVQRRLDRHDERVANWLDRWLSIPRQVSWAAGSCLGIRRKAFDAVGGFDEDFFLYFEDIDFCLRLGDAGYGVKYDPCATVLHHRGASMAQQPERCRQAYRRSQLRFWNKHGRAFQRIVVRQYVEMFGAASGL